MRKGDVQVRADIRVIASDRHAFASDRLGDDLATAEYVCEITVCPQARWRSMPLAASGPNKMSFRRLAAWFSEMASTTWSGRRCGHGGISLVGVTAPFLWHVFITWPPVQGDSMTAHSALPRWAGRIRPRPRTVSGFPGRWHVNAIHTICRPSSRKADK